MKVKFHYDIVPSESFGEITTAAFWLSVNSPVGPIPFFFLFDTGADVTSLPASAAEKLGIDLDSCPQESMSGYEGSTIVVYRSEITFHFYNKVVTIPCVFHPNEEVPILLGRAGILDRFIIVLDGKKKEITFEKI